MHDMEKKRNNVVREKKNSILAFYFRNIILKKTTPQRPSPSRPLISISSLAVLSFCFVATWQRRVFFCFFFRNQSGGRQHQGQVTTSASPSVDRCVLNRMISPHCSADEEAGAVGEETELTASAAASAAANASPASAKSDAGARPSLTNRLSSLYESLLSKAAPKKLSGDRVSGGVGNNGADIDVKVSRRPPPPPTKQPKQKKRKPNAFFGFDQEAAIVYAELELKAPEEGAANGAGAASPTSPAKEETEYAEIVAVTTTQDKSPAQSPVKETADNKTE